MASVITSASSLTKGYSVTMSFPMAAVASGTSDIVERVAILCCRGELQRKVGRKERERKMIKVVKVKITHCGVVGQRGLTVRSKPTTCHLIQYSSPRPPASVNWQKQARLWTRVMQLETFLQMTPQSIFSCDPVVLVKPLCYACFSEIFHSTISCH